MEGDLRSLSLYFELYDLTITIADRFRMTPFEVFAQDCDEVVSLINYFLVKDQKKPKSKATGKKQNDGFWDF